MKLLLVTTYPKMNVDLINIIFLIIQVNPNDYKIFQFEKIMPKKIRFPPNFNTKRHSLLLFGYIYLM